MNDWPERRPQDYRLAQDFWATLGFKERVIRGEIAFVGEVRSRLKLNEAWEEKTFHVAVLYPLAFPYAQPRIDFLEPAIRYSRHLQEGKPCLFPPDDWDTTVPPSEIYKKLMSWLRSYRTGVWTNELPLYELPAYFRSSAVNVLISEDTLPSMGGRQRGTFSVQCFEGHAVAVLASVDSVQVGKALSADLRLRPAGKLNGKWYRLSEEPEPAFHEKHLIDVLDRHGFDRRPDTRREPQYVGLVFPDVHLGSEQLLLLRVAPKDSKARRPVGQGWPITSMPVHLVSHQETFKRLEGVRDLKELDAKKVTIFGCGAIGSHLAKALCREGVGAFRLADPDILKPGNVVRHALDLTAVGRGKADALAEALHRISPHCEAEAVFDRLAEPASLQQHFQDSDVVVAAIGDDVKEAMLSEIAVTTGSTPLVLVRTLHSGSAYRVCLIRPGRDACMTCLTLHDEDEHPGWVSVPGDDLQPIYDNGCASPSRPGAGIASEQAALHAAEVVLELLEGADSNTNNWLTVRKPIAGDDARLRERGTHESVLHPHDECRSCVE